MGQRSDFLTLFEPLEVLFELAVDELVIDTAHPCGNVLHRLLLSAANLLFLQEFVKLGSLLFIEVALKKELQGS